MTAILDIKERLDAIEARNERVTADKAWETSIARRLSISGLTYAVVVVYLIIVGNEHPWINSLVPAMGYFLSTLVLARVKATWTRWLLRKRGS